MMQSFSNDLSTKYGIIFAVVPFIHVIDSTEGSWENEKSWTIPMLYYGRQSPKPQECAHFQLCVYAALAQNTYYAPTTHAA